MLHYTVYGSGFPLVLLHGFCENSGIWDDMLPLPCGDVQYIVPDLPGFGKASPEMAHSMEAHAEYVHAILSKEGIHKCILTGHSMSGYVALHFAQAYPSMIAGIGLFHSHAFADTEEQKEGRDKAMDFIRRKGAESYLDAFAENMFAADTREDVRMRYRETIRGTSAEGLIAALGAMRVRNDSLSVLRNISVPVLFAFGRQDKLMDIVKLLSQCMLPVVSQITILEHSGHLGMMEEPSKSAHILCDFVTLCKRKVK